MRHLVLIALALTPGASVAQGDVDWSRAEVLEVTLTNFAFAPNALRLERGTVYRLHLVNNGSGGHSFVAPELFAAATVSPADQTKLKDGGIELARGGTADISFVPRNAGAYPIRCTHFLHTSFGMTGRAEVL